MGFPIPPTIDGLSNIDIKLIDGDCLRKQSKWQDRDDGKKQKTLLVELRADYQSKRYCIGRMTIMKLKGPGCPDIELGVSVSIAHRYRKLGLARFLYEMCYLKYGKFIYSGVTSLVSLWNAPSESFSELYHDFITDHFLALDSKVYDGLRISYDFYTKRRTAMFLLKPHLPDPHQVESAIMGSFTGKLFFNWFGNQLKLKSTDVVLGQYVMSRFTIDNKVTKKCHHRLL